MMKISEAAKAKAQDLFPILVQSRIEGKSMNESMEILARALDEFVEERIEGLRNAVEIARKAFDEGVEDVFARLELLAREAKKIGINFELKHYGTIEPWSIRLRKHYYADTAQSAVEQAEEEVGK